MLRSAIAILLFLATTILTTSACASEPLIYDAYLDGHIDIAPDGSVKDFSIAKKRLIEDRSLWNALSRQIRAWRFQPVFAEGPPAIARVFFGINLRAETKAQSNRMVVTLSDVHFYDLPAADPSGKPVAPMQPPTFPVGPDREGVGALVDVMLELDQDSRIVRTGISKMALLSPTAQRPRESERYIQEFRAATLAAASHWTISPNQRGACGQPCLVTVPVRFSPCNCLYGFWTNLQQIPVAPLPWATPQTPVVQIGPGGAPASTHQLVDPTQAQGQL